MLWQIDETGPSLRAGLPLTVAEETDLASITHPTQRVEWLACRVALQMLVGRERYAGLWKDEFGKPHLIGLPGHISLSHTGGWAAVVWHDSAPVGIDIEPQREQLRRVVPRVLSAAEIAHANGKTERLAVYWCAKEALYKLYGKRKLTFREHLSIDPFTDGSEMLTGHVRLPNHNATLTIRCFRAGPGWVAVAF